MQKYILIDNTSEKRLFPRTIEWLKSPKDHEFQFYQSL